MYDSFFDEGYGFNHLISKSEVQGLRARPNTKDAGATFNHSEETTQLESA